MFWEIERAWARRSGTKPPQSNPKTIIGGLALSVLGWHGGGVAVMAWRRGELGAAARRKIYNPVQPGVVGFLTGKRVAIL